MMNPPEGLGATITASRLCNYARTAPASDSIVFIIIIMVVALLGLLMVPRSISDNR
jgi:hypothetical protein